MHISSWNEADAMVERDRLLLVGGTDLDLRPLSLLIGVGCSILNYHCMGARPRQTESTLSHNG
jgi:hypothetical protein